MGQVVCIFACVHVWSCYAHLFERGDRALQKGVLPLSVVHRRRRRWQLDAYSSLAPAHRTRTVLGPAARNYG